MSTKNPSVTIARIDHGVLPSNDLGRAFRFWSGFMGARLEFLTNMNARGLNREVPLIVFFAVANHPGFGIALQDFRLAKPVRALEGVVWAFEVAAADRLHDSDALERQVERMLADPRAQRFVVNFVGQWLRLREIGRAHV